MAKRRFYFYIIESPKGNLNLRIKIMFKFYYYPKDTGPQPYAQLNVFVVSFWYLSKVQNKNNI